MFFGLFSTHLPFVIVGLVYLASVGIVSVQRLANSFSAEDDTVEISSQNLTYSENNDHLLAFQLPDYQQLQSALIAEQEGLDHSIPEILIKLFTVSEPPPCGFHSGEFFIRPPPATV